MENIATIPRYKNYKDSGVDWLGKIPESWELVPVRGVLSFRNEKNDPVKTKDVLSLSIANGVTRYSDKGRGGNKRKDDLTAYKIAMPNDIVMNSMNVIVGAVGVSKFFGAISPVYYALYARNESVSIPYYARIFQDAGFQRGLLRLGKGILIKSGDSGKMNTIRMKISQDDLKTLIFPKPDFKTQTAIANFLEKKTTQIDEAIAIKEKQIALLKERKHIIIQKAVTQGLNPNVPMKDSGIDWIGQIPEHWEIVELKRLVELLQTGPFGTELHAHDYIINGVPLINPKHMKYNKIMPENSCSISNEIAEKLGKYKLKTNDLIMARRGELGRCAVITKKENGWVCGTGSLIVRLKTGIFNTYYLFRLISGKGVSDMLTLESVGSTMDNLNTTILGKLLLPILPKDEQDEIINYLDAKTIKINQAINLQKLQIEKLKEYKITLINSAVTGKIKET